MKKEVPQIGKGNNTTMKMLTEDMNKRKLEQLHGHILENSWYYDDKIPTFGIVQPSTKITQEKNWGSSFSFCKEKNKERWNTQ